VTAPTLRFDDAIGDDILPVSLDALVRTRLLVQGNSGAGKSYAVRALLEQTHGRVQQIVLDPEGEFSTLRERFEYVLAGEGGDVPAHPKIARVLCRRLFETGANAVINLFDLSLADRREFVDVFLVELMSLPRALWKPALIVIDEAHRFCPERGSGEARSTDAVITLCTQGRKRGFSAVLATQRISKLHKDAAAELLNKLVGRTHMDIDVKRAGDELGMDRTSRAQLADLKNEFFAFGPAIPGGVQRVRSAEVLTTHPDSSAIGKIPATLPPASASVQALIAEIGDLPKLAVKEADERAALEREVRELKQQLRAKPVPVSSAPSEEALRAEYSRGIDVGRVMAHESTKLAAIGAQLQVLGRLTDLVSTLHDEVHSTADRVMQDIKMPTAATVQRMERAIAPRTVDVVKLAPLSPAVEPRETNSGAVPGVQQRILDTLAGLADLGIAWPDKVTVAALCGYHKNSKSYANAMGALRSSGLIMYPAGGQIALTAGGAAQASASLPVRSCRELHEVWFEKLGNVARRLLEPLLNHYPNALPASDVAAAADYHPNSKSFANMRGRLKTLGLIDYPRPGYIAATALLFPEGLR
jgi:hypothetical protein